jgi:hypothetical protein
MICYTPCPDPQNSKKELVCTSSFPHVNKGGDQRLVRNCISQFRISGLRHSCGEVFLTPPSFWYPKLRNGVGSMVHTPDDSTVQISSRFRILRFRHSYDEKVSSLDPSISRYPILQKGSRINGPDQTLN